MKTKLVSAILGVSMAYLLAGFLASYLNLSKGGEGLVALIAGVVYIWFLKPQRMAAWVVLLSLVVVTEWAASESEELVYQGIRAELLVRDRGLDEERAGLTAAVEYHRRARTRYPLSTNAWESEVASLLKLHRVDEALGIAKNGNRLFPRKPEMTYYLAKSWMENGDMEMARALYERAKEQGLRIEEVEVPMPVDRWWESRESVNQ